MSTYRIPDRNIQRLTAELDKLVKRAAKLGQSIAYTLGTPDDTIMDDGHVKRVWPVTITGDAPRLNGWAFVATITPALEGVGNLLKCVPGETVPAEYRAVSLYCDHCCTTRQRLNTYVLRHDTGEHKQVGSSCLRDFLGHADPHAWASMLECILDAHDLAEESADDFMGGMGPRRPSLIATDKYLAHVWAIVGERGWLPRSKAGYGQVATADRALDSLYPLDDHAKRAAIKPTAADERAASEALVWCREVLSNRADLSDYEYNLTVACRASVAKWKWAGIVASLYVCYTRAMEREVKAQEIKRASANSQHVGQVGKREVFTLTVTRIFDSEGQYGVTHIHNLTDDNGNAFVWFASAKRLAEGKRYTGKATVKAHGEYKEVKQTTITRFDPEEVK